MKLRRRGSASNSHMYAAPRYSPGLSNGPTTDSSRSLSPGETFQAAFGQFKAGLSDATRLKTTISLINDDPRVKSSILRSTVLQIVLLASVVALEFVLAPKLAKRGLSGHHADKLQFWYQLVWIWPLFGASFLLAGSANVRVSQSQDGTRLQAERHGITTEGQSSLAGKVTNGLARTGVIVQCFILSFVLNKIPLVGWLLSFLFFCIVGKSLCYALLQSDVDRFRSDAYYCFE